MKILITGGCGFLGHHLVEHFLKNTDAQIVVLDKLTYASAGFDRLRDIQAFDDKRAQVLVCDLTKPIEPALASEMGDISYIIHAAAETHVDNSISNPLPFLESNVIGTHNLLMYARTLSDIKRVFVISTDEVYGPAMFGAPGFLPGDPVFPTNPYAASKVGAEAISTAYANTFGLPITIVNGMNFFGERQHPEKYLPKVIRYVQAGIELQIHANADRTISGTRFYLHCRNFASALSFMMERKKPLPWKVHVVGEREISNLDLARNIAAIVGKILNFRLVDFHSSRPGHDLRYAMRDNWLAGEGWKHPIPIEQSLQKTVRWYLDPKNSRWLDWK